MQNKAFRTNIPSIIHFQNAMKIKGILSCLFNARNLKKNQLKINKNCGEGAPFESNHMMDSHHMALFSTPLPKEKGCRYKYPGGSELTGTAAWGRASPNYPAISCFSFLQSFVRRRRSALHALSHPKTSGKGNGASGWAKEYAHLGLGEKSSKHNTPKTGIGFLGQGEVSNPLLQGSIRPVCKYPCNTLVKCRSCSAPFAGFLDIAGLVFAYKALLSSEIM